MYTDRQNRTKLQKVLLAALYVMALVFALLTAVLRTQERVYMGGMMMALSHEGDTAVYTARQDGYDVTVRRWEENGGITVDYTRGSHIHQVGRVTYPEGSISDKNGRKLPRVQVHLDGRLLFDGCYDPQVTRITQRYFGLNGYPQGFSAATTITHEGVRVDADLSVAAILGFADGPELSVRGSWEGYFVCLLLTAIAAAGIAFPHAVFRWNHRFTVKNPEPTEFYLFMHKISGALVTVLLLIAYMKALWTVVPA